MTSVHVYNTEQLTNWINQKREKQGKKPISARRVRQYLEAGRIPEAIKIPNGWLIPKDKAIDPVDPIGRES